MMAFHFTAERGEYNGETSMVIARRAFLLGAVTTTASLALASCSSSPTNSMVLKVAQNSSAFSYFPIFVATQQGFFKAQGLTFDPDPVPITGNGAKTAPGIEAGNIEVAIGTITDAFTLSRIDASIKIVGSVCNAFLIDLIASNAFLSATGLNKQSPLESKVKALVGKKVGISSPGTATDGLITYLFRQYGYDDQRDVVKVNLGNVTPTTALSALSSGHIDIVSWPVPSGQVAEAQGIGRLFISPVLGDIPAMGDMLYSIIYTRQPVIDMKPKAVAAFIRAVAQAEAFIRDEPKQTAALLTKFLKLDSHTTNAVAKAALSAMPASPQIDQHTYQVANDFHVKAGLIAIALPYNALVATDTIRKALA